MLLNFNSEGFLHKTITLTREEFGKHFGTNPIRAQQINNAMAFFRIFQTYGCKVVYVDGSFVSKKKYPEDIDLCFDVTRMDMEKFEMEIPSLFDFNALGRIHRDQQCHIFTFEKNNTTYFDMLSQDRDGNLKGFVKLFLNDLPIHYD